MATNKWALRFTGPASTPSPIAAGQKALTVSKVRNYLSGMGSSGSATMATASDQVAAVGGITLSSASGTVGVDINGVACTDTAAGGDNATASLIVTAVNTTATSALVTKHVTAQRGQAKAYGKFTSTSITPGACSPSVDGTACSFTATGVDATDAALLAAAINAQATACKKVYAWSDANASTAAAARITHIVARDGASWNLTNTVSAGQTVGVTINGITVTAAYNTSQNQTTTDLATAINASAALKAQGWLATATTNVVTLLSAGTTNRPITVTGTGMTVASDVITCSGTSNGTAITATINGYTASATAGSSDTNSAVALVAALNALPSPAGVVAATNSSGVITVLRNTVADDSYTVLGAAQGGATTAVAVTSNGSAGKLYGGELGNALTLTTSGNCVRSGATLTTGVTAVVLTSKIPGFAGNAVTTAANGTGITAIGARLLGGTETQGSFTFP